ncbi:enoyl-CoA hydratase/isomerase family protein [Nocardioides humi]|uniref:Enoyl-CoA hydratase/isomerase n=1 Tax=Nocardioides humi TaxID=449461 RepID=A0ABN2B3K7_9ACTN|nr:enoyl-CoA hydratase-related protein [Nocardioides humi]
MVATGGELSEPSPNGATPPAPAADAATPRVATLLHDESSPGATVEMVLARQLGPLLHIELARPEKLNALSPAMGRQLRAIVESGAADPTVRGILLTGRGRGFCSGADISGPATTGPDGVVDASRHLDEIFHPLILTLREAGKPIVAGLRGPCVGIGLAIALACDLIVMSDTSYLMVPFVRIGLGLDGGLAAQVTDRVGLTRASELLMLGERLDSATALDWGLVNKVVPDDELDHVVTTLATTLAEGPTVALASIKQALLAASTPDFASHLALEARLQRETGRSEDYRLGREAFQDRSAVRFTGR